MAGAPVLSGTAGALIGVLDAVLVNGFGLQTVSSLVVTGGVAVVTVPTTPSAVVDSVVTVAGATPAGLNGEKRVTTVTSNSLSFATTEANGTASGTITVKVAAAGWSKLYSDTNIAAYKIIEPMGSGFVLRVDDTGATTVRVRGYEAMSDINTGSGPFPSVAQTAGLGLWWSKSNVASSDARPWRIVADSRGMYFFPKNANTSSEHQGNYFGDILPIKSNDPYACVLRANISDRSTATSITDDSLAYADSNQTYNGMYAARAANTLGGSVKHHSTPVMTAGFPNNYAIGDSGWTYPSPVDNGLMLSDLVIYSIEGYRGYFPGICASPQLVKNAFSTGDYVYGSGNLVGSKFNVVKLGGATPVSTTQAVLFVNQSSDWR